MTWTTLHDACEHQDTEKILIRSDANPHEAAEKDDHGLTPLHIACWQNPPVKVVNALIAAYPEAVTTQDVHGDTPLHCLLTAGTDTSADVVRALLKASPAVASIVNKEGLCPLHEACRYHVNEEVIEVLLEAYPDALRIPIKKGNPAPRKSKTIADRKVSDHVIVDGTRRLSGTVTDLRFEAADQQIRDGAYPLHMAIASKSSKGVVEMLMLAAPEVLKMTNKFGETPLHVSMAVNADTEIVELLLHNREDLGALAMADNVHGNLPLHLAAIHGCQDGVAVLLLTEYPGASKVKNAVGKTPLDLARECNHCSSDFLHLLEREATSPRNVIETSATLKWPDDSAD